MRVMHILDSLNRGGAEIMVLDLCRNAKRNGLDLVFAATGGGQLENEFRNSGVPFFRLQRRLPVDLRLAVRLGKLVADNEIDVVHVHQAVEGMHAYLATRGSSVRRVMTFHLAHANARNRVALKFLLPRMHANIAVSRDLQKTLAATSFASDAQLEVVYNGLDARRLAPSGHDLRKELDLAKDTLLLGMVGNFYPDNRKDQLTLCRAFATLLESAPNACLLLVGSAVGDGLTHLTECKDFCSQHGILGKVRFLGSRNDVADILQSLDLYVHSAVDESFGIAVIEAMLAGVPTVVSDIGALLEATCGGRYTNQFHAGDAADLTEKLRTLTANESARQKLSEEARHWAIQQFGIDTHIASLKRVYEGVLSLPVSSNSRSTKITTRRN